MMRLAVFASGRGSNFENIITCRLPGVEIVLLVTDTVCNALEIARTHNIPTKTYLRQEYPSKEAMEQAIVDTLEDFHVDFIVLAGYMRLLSSAFVSRYPRCIINIHPSLLPLYKGKDAIGQAFEDGKKMYGVSVHYVNEGMDEGEVIAQVKVSYDGKDIVELEQLIHQAEYALYPKVIAQLCSKGEES